MPALTTATVGATLTTVAHYRGLRSMNPIYDTIEVGAVLVLPAVLTLIAKRHPFLWGLAPYPIGFAMYMVADRHELVDVIALGITAVVYLTPVWLISSGVGLGLRRLRERQAKLAARAGSKPLNVQDPSVWPPAPKL